ncbi:hypothetical protein MAIT1_04490 [Magnetofaba australis IT-1]|uniref:Uncharacterized protein n=1 Tax=Magnetofaba australis IT-1 TaxID=1434232 RepID=A0A1Y2K9X3_9PROT|nr:hypothetical protein MAIT1_04490 [Magnetofaba australis IT-1]
MPARRMPQILKRAGVIEVEIEPRRVQLRGDHVVGELPRVGVEQQLVGIETVARVVHVGDEARFAAAPPPSRIECPVGPPAAKGVEAMRWGLANARAPDVVIGIARQPVVVDDITADGAVMNLQQDALGAAREHRHQQVAIVKTDAQGPRCARPAGCLNRAEGALLRVEFANRHAASPSAPLRADTPVLLTQGVTLTTLSIKRDGARQLCTPRRRLRAPFRAHAHPVQARPPIAPPTDKQASTVARQHTDRLSPDPAP